MYVRALSGVNSLDEIQITGGRALEGSVIVQGSKNAALPMMAASLLHRGVSVLRGCPRITDVYCMEEILYTGGRNGDLRRQYRAYAFLCDPSGRDAGEERERDGGISRRMRDWKKACGYPCLCAEMSRSVCAGKRKRHNRPPSEVHRRNSRFSEKECGRDGTGGAVVGSVGWGDRAEKLCP